MAFELHLTSFCTENSTREDMKEEEDVWFIETNKNVALWLVFCDLEIHFCES